MLKNLFLNQDHHLLKKRGLIHHDPRLRLEVAVLRRHHDQRHHLRAVALHHTHDQHLLLEVAAVHHVLVREGIVEVEVEAHAVSQKEVECEARELISQDS